MKEETQHYSDSPVDKPVSADTCLEKENCLRSDHHWLAVFLINLLYYWPPALANKAKTIETTVG